MESHSKVTYRENSCLFFHVLSSIGQLYKPVPLPDTLIHGMKVAREPGSSSPTPPNANSSLGIERRCNPNYRYCHMVAHIVSHLRHHELWLYSSILYHTQINWQQSISKKRYQQAFIPSDVHRL